MHRLILSLTLLLLGSGVYPSGAAASQWVEDVIRIEADRLVYKKKSVKIPITRKALIEVFGPPSREVYNVAGNVLIWDELGISCYGCQEQVREPEEFQYMSDAEIRNYQRSNYIGTLSMYARKYSPYPEHEKTAVHKPRLPFAGTIMLQDVRLDGTVTLVDFMEKRRGEQTILLPENSFSFFVRCTPEPHEITLHTIRDKYDSSYLSIFSVSIRNIGHFYKKIRCLEVFETEQPPAELMADKEAEQRFEPPIMPMMQAE